MLKRIYTLIPLIFLFAVSSGQTIQLVRFDNTPSYAPGSGVSLHFIPNLFKIGNTFTLQLSNAAGSFAAPVDIGTVADFFVPVINGVIPAGTPAGNNYRLRIVGSAGNIISAPTSPFRIIAGPQLARPSIEAVAPVTMPVKCLGNSNFFGYLNMQSGASSLVMSFDIKDYDPAVSWTVNLINSTGTVRSVLPVNAGNVEIGSLPIGYYMVELVKTQNGVTSVFSYVVLVARNGTGLTNLSSEQVCTGSPVQFRIDGINDNYPGSKYTIAYGDGSATETYTQDSLMVNPLLSHIFTSPTCNSSFSIPDPNNNNNRAFAVDLQLFNKGLANNCADYTTNSQKKSFVNASTPPEADFIVPQAVCNSSGINATNTSIGGYYGSGAVCVRSFVSTWQYKKPSSSTYQNAPAAWVNSVTGNLSIPANVVTERGCWSLRLQVQNPEGCPTVSTKEKTVGVEIPLTAAFNVSATTICSNQSVSVTDQSNANAGGCQRPVYSWTISPSTGFTINGPNTPNPTITFIDAGVYTIVQNITNSCGTYSSAARTVTVNGAPFVSFSPANTSLCRTGPLNETIDFSQAPFKPTYSTSSATPAITSWSWTVDGPAADYEFITASNIDYPSIRFKTFRCYNITVTVNGNCNPPNSKTLQLCFKQSPEITTTPLSATICSKGTAPAINLTSNMPGASFSWQAVYSGVTPIGPASGTTNIPSRIYEVTGASPGSITYTMAATVNGCTGPAKQYVVAVTPSANAEIKYEGSPICNTLATSPVKLTGTTGGTFTASPGGLVIDAVTGTISPTASTPGTYTVTYAVAASPPCVAFSTTTTVTINQGNAASAGISYPAELCNVANTAATPNPPVAVVRTGTPGGTYSIAPVTGLTIDAASGTINPAGATPGTYTITYTIANTAGCADYKVTANVTIQPAPTAQISYAGPVCASVTAVPVSLSGTTGGTYSAAAGLAINATTGTINPSLSTPGTYTITYTVAPSAACPGTSATANIIITRPPSASINYPATLCNVANTPSTPNLPVPVTHTGTTGGIYSIAPATGLKIDAVTGTLDPSGAAPGTYIITYTVAAAGGCNTFTTSATVNVNGTPTATIWYTSPLCSSAGIAAVTRTGNAGGTYTATPTGLVIDAATGAINTLQSTPGTYEVTYTIAPSAPCPGFETKTTVQITQAPSANITYPAVLCNVANTSATPNNPVAVVQTGTTGGTYSIQPASGLSIDANTGTITPSNATAGTYTITYTITGAGGCPAFTTSATVVVNSSPTASISYPGSPYCNGITQVQPVTRTGNTGGVYTAGPGLSLDRVTGAINPSLSMPGTYTVTYTITPAPPCFVLRTSTSVTITEAPAISVVNPAQTICSGETAVFGITPSLANISVNWSVTGALPPGVAGISSGNIAAPATAVSLRFTNTGSTSQTLSIQVVPVNPAQNPCAGPPVVMQLTVNPISPLPVVDDTIKYCQAAPVVPLTAGTAPGHWLIWYDDNGQLLPAAPTPSTAIPAQFIYFVSQVNAYNCESPKKKVVVVVKPTPVISFNALKDPTDCGIPSGAVILTVTSLNSTIPIANAAFEIYYNKDYSGNTTGPVTGSTNAAGELRIALTAGTYSNIRVVLNGCISNTLAGPYVLKDPTPPGIPAAGYNTNLCSNDTLRLTALSVPGVLGSGDPNGSVPVSYVWAGPAFGNSNHTTSGSTIALAPPLEQKAGFYVVYALQGNCRSVETSFIVTVKQAPSKPVVVTRTPLCVGDELPLRANSSMPGNSPQLNYTWTGPGFSTPINVQNTGISSVTVNDGGLYTITATSPVTGCSAQTDTLIRIGNYPEIVLRPGLVTAQTGTLMPLKPIILNSSAPNVLPMQSYSWTPATDLTCYGNGCDSAVATVKRDVCYQVKATNIYGCSDTASICIKAFCQNAQVFIPNAFTPDGDGQNDIFMVRATGIASVKSFRIFNRYGEVVFEKYNFTPNNPAFGWNGTIKGQRGIPAVYVYTAEVVCENGTTYAYHGNVTLLR
ncbi:gliding motility-associated C-terminal domain-containing protein [Parasegetibacter sp. NRK P23]|uniref:T9SS type B sorting domain-containing protein n=1 Tax=Parasegetibacter sp. NRK P23 TaxID=2942999 RepID=UPI0020446762|nr:gliding motility-associated C-terminal domain-containing protein [Parasegetibacter sp. NRK P23]MCM5527890.1 gliding motility-associated C-terminal domain-containing protein [Parasegetibacter sp. NRK P23]